MMSGCCKHGFADQASALMKVCPLCLAADNARLEEELKVQGEREVAAWGERDQYLQSNVKLVAEIQQQRSLNARMRAVWDDVGVGGNHLANFLIHRLGGDFASHYAPSDKSVPAALGKIDPEALDVWYCWAALMRARDALEQEQG